MFAWRVTRIDPSQSARLIGELRLAQWAAILIAAAGAMPIGLSVAGPAIPAAHLDAWLGVLFVVLAGLLLQREPREALVVASLVFIIHALVDIAHRPGWLPPDVAPKWFTVGCAIFDVYLAAVCYWAQRR
jgi:hypothetical protein